MTGARWIGACGNGVREAARHSRSSTRFGPIPIEQGPAAGQSILYFQSPWGLQLEAITYPNGMAYEKDGGPVLWSPKDPAK